MSRINSKSIIAFASLCFALNLGAMENPNNFPLKPDKEEVPFKDELIKKKQLAISHPLQKSHSSNSVLAPKELTTSLFDTQDLQEKNKRIIAAFNKADAILLELDRFSNEFPTCYEDVKFLGTLKNNGNMGKWHTSLINQPYKDTAEKRIETSSKLEKIVLIGFALTALASFAQPIRADLSPEERVICGNIFIASIISSIFHQALSIDRDERIRIEVEREIEQQMIQNKIKSKPKPEANYIALTNLLLFIKPNIAQIRESLNEHKNNILQLINPQLPLGQLPTLTVVEMEAEIKNQVGVLKAAKDILAINKAIKDSGLWMLLASCNLLK